jgi:hypothetical protein
VIDRVRAACSLTAQADGRRNRQRLPQTKARYALRSRGVSSAAAASEGVRVVAHADLLVVLCVRWRDWLQPMFAVAQPRPLSLSLREGGVLQGMGLGACVVHAFGLLVVPCYSAALLRDRQLCGFALARVPD